MNEEDLGKLRKSMPKNYRYELAIKFTISVPYVDKIFRGLTNRSDVIDYAIQMATEYKNHLKELKLKIEEL